MPASESSQFYDDDNRKGSEEDDDAPKLSYVEYKPRNGDPGWPTTGWALQAAVVAALAAVLIGTGIAILIAIF